MSARWRHAPRPAGLAAAVAVSMAAMAAAASLPPATAAAVAAPAVPGDPDGRAVYVAQCAACHMPTGTGIAGAFPPLAGSSWATGDERLIVRIVLHGLTGEIELDGETYAGLMPPLGAVLSDAEIAAVATYVRSSWGNAAPAVAEATVARERAATAGRSEPWTAAELFGGLEMVK